LRSTAVGEAILLCYLDLRDCFVIRLGLLAMTIRKDFSDVSTCYLKMLEDKWNMLAYMKANTIRLIKCVLSVT